MKTTTSDEDYAWVFLGEGAQHPSGVFTRLEIAEDWIQRHELSGLLTAYPINTGVWEWAVDHEYFVPKGPKHESSAFVGRFSSASMDHHHYEHGHRIGT